MTAGWTLRRRLVLGILALLAAASVIVGLVSVVALRDFLFDRVDAQLASATGRTELATSGELGDAPVPSTPRDGSDALPFGVQGPLTVTGIVAGDLVEAGIVTEHGEIRFLTPERAEALLSVPATGAPVTVKLGGGLGAYRAAGSEIASGVTVVTALPLAEVDRTLQQLVAVSVAVALAVLAAAALAGHAVVGLALRPLERVAATASAVANLPLDRGDVDLVDRVALTDADPTTEVGRVGAAFNRMLDHVAAAFDARQRSEKRVRRFVADASHELRTPLTSIRGYAELTRRAGHDLPPDVAHSLARVESEAIRMTSLVEDLLLLARLDEGRDLERREVDLSRLVAEAVGDAAVASSDHEWGADIPPEPVVVLGDDGRLRQVIANLLANARVHTPPGTRVGVTLRHADGMVIMDVTDDGPGIDPELQPRIFERFARGDSSRSRVAGSTGLGLAIVGAVVTGHGGTVGVDSKPGFSRITVRLPANDAGGHETISTPEFP